MDANEILKQLAGFGPPAIEAIHAAQADRAAMVPVFLAEIERYLAAGGDEEAENALFFIFHLLGEWRERTAYRPLARLLQGAPEDVDAILGGAVTETSHRVMAAVFDGDPAPLYAIIHDRHAEEYIRSRMLEALAMVTLRGEMPRDEIARFLRACHSELQPQDECWVWNGWQSAIALLGLTELTPLVEQAFARGFISDYWMTLQDFQEDLQRAIANPADPACPIHDDLTLFGATVEELSPWSCFRPQEEWESEEPWESDWTELDEAEAETEKSRHSVLHRPWEGPAVNPHKHIGRNDPCPCGSGRKYKKCCLPTQTIALPAA